MNIASIINLTKEIPALETEFSKLISGGSILSELPTIINDVQVIEKFVTEVESHDTLTNKLDAADVALDAIFPGYKSSIDSANQAILLLVVALGLK